MRVVRVLNASKGTVIAERAEMADSFLTRLRGLLGRQGLSENSGLVLRPTSSIHSFFMAFAFDAVFLDRANRVVHVLSAMPPNRIGPMVRHTHSIVELPAGAIARSLTAPGDQIEIG